MKVDVSCHKKVIQVSCQAYEHCCKKTVAIYYYYYYFAEKLWRRSDMATFACGQSPLEKFLVAPVF